MNAEFGKSKKLGTAFVSAIILTLLVPIIVTTPAGTASYSKQANAADCLLTFELHYEKILVHDDHDHVPVLEADPGEWDLFVHDPNFDDLIQVMHEQDIFDEEENEDGNGGMYFLNEGVPFKPVFTIKYGDPIDVFSRGDEWDPPEPFPYLLGVVNVQHDATNFYALGSHAVESSPADYHLFYTLSLISRSGDCPDDDDLDGIHNSVDTQPNVVSHEFSDEDIDGTTTGVFTNRGDQIIRVREGLPEPPVACASLVNHDFPDGKCVNIGSVGGGANPALAYLCDGESYLGFLPGDIGDLRCGSINFAATSGSPSAHLVAGDGSSADLEIPEGNAITFDETTSIITASSSNTDTLIAETNDGRELQIAAGNSESIIPDTTPPDTTIESAVDGNGDDMLSIGETYSRSIEFTFTGEDNVDQLLQLKFECRVDGNAGQGDFAECENPHEYADLALGERTVEVRAIDRAGNIDPTPATFTWIIYLEAEIDIMSGDDAVSTINPKAKGTTTVAILGSEEFGDVSNVDISSIKFEGASPSSTKPRIEDVNVDGIEDLILKFSSPNIILESGDTEGCMVGELVDGTPFKGCDEVRVI